MGDERLQKDASTTPETEELLDHERLSRALSLDTSLVPPDAKAPVTDLCLTCQDNIMRFIRYIPETVYYLDPKEGTQVQSVLHSVYKSLQEDYLRLELWIHDSSVSKGSEYLALGSPIETPIRAAISVIHDQLSLLKELVDDLKNQTTLDPNKHSFSIELAGREITRNIRILAQLQSLVHSAQSILFPETGQPGNIQAQVDGIYDAFVVSGKLLETQEGDFISKSDLKTSSSVNHDGEAGFQKCEYCGKIFLFGSIDLHQELSHIGYIPKAGVSAFLSPSSEIQQGSLEGMPSFLKDHSLGDNLGRLTVGHSSRDAFGSSPSMSGIGEASLVLGIISSIISIIDATNQVYEAVKDEAGLPTNFKKSATKLPLISKVLEDAERYVNSAADVSIKAAFTPTLEDCEAQATQLQELFKKVMPEEGDSRWARYVKAARTIGKGGRVESLVRGILQDLQLLATRFPEVTTPRGKDQLAKAIEEVAEMEPSLPDDGFEQMPAYAHYGSGAQNNNIGGGTQNNNNSTGNQNIGGQMYIGTNHIGTPKS
ncbi:hypothetical protein BKA61DRAFT_605258 [Leptodontidium sp. MPI-SDFR-AT-0119]|nr:hypothetical protein BKA61DRAFT_605258 [Leptodontidium sp. MPI-SDFR-AT-0119]